MKKKAIMNPNFGRCDISVNYCEHQGPLAPWEAVQSGGPEG